MSTETLFLDKRRRSREASQDMVAQTLRSVAGAGVLITIEHLACPYAVDILLMPLRRRTYGGRI